MSLMVRWTRGSLAARLWLACSLCTVVVLGTATALRLAAERDLVAATMVRDRRFFGESWWVLLSTASAGDADRMVASLENDPLVRSRHIQVTIDSLEAAHRRASQMPLHQRERLTRGQVASALVGDRLRTFIPISRGERSTVIELDEPLSVSEHLANIHGITTLATSLVLLAMTAVVTWLLVRQLVRRPLELLGKHAARVGQGDLETRLELPGTTELSLLAESLNGMSDALHAAESEVRRLDTDRAHLQASLRHADRLRTAGQLSAALAHEIGTPLSVVIGRAQLVARDAGSSAASRENAEIVVREGRRVGDLVRRLLGFARRVTSLSIEAEPANDVIARALDLVVLMAVKRGVRIQTDTALAASVRLSRPDEIVQVLTNLAVNAIQACPEGSILEVVAKPASSNARTGLMLSIIDHGPGIDPLVLPHVFEPFFTTKPEDQGTGLGLSVVRGIVDERGGTLTHTPTPGGGATFHVWLPEADGGAAPAGERRQVRTAPPPG